MAVAFSFDEIQKAADEKFGDFELTVPAKDEEGKPTGEVETLTFKHVLRVPREVRNAYGKASDPKTYAKDPAFKKMDVIEGILHITKEGFKVVAATPRDFERLEETIRDSNDGLDDYAHWSEIFALYQSETQTGEA